jgi:hypothetical protein
MMTPFTEHPTEQTLERHALLTLATPPSADSNVRTHLEGCASCRAIVEEYRAVHAAVSGFLPDPRVDQWLSRHARIPVLPPTVLILHPVLPRHADDAQSIQAVALAAKDMSTAQRYCIRQTLMTTEGDAALYLVADAVTGATILQVTLDASADKQDLLLQFEGMESYHLLDREGRCIVPREHLPVSLAQSAYVFLPRYRFVITDAHAATLRTDGCLHVRTEGSHGVLSHAETGILLERVDGIVPTDSPPVTLLIVSAEQSRVVPWCSTRLPIQPAEIRSGTRLVWY